MRRRSSCARRPGCGPSPTRPWSTGTARSPSPGPAAWSGCWAPLRTGWPPMWPPRAAWPGRAAVTRWPNWSWCSGWPRRWRGPTAWTPTGPVTSTGRSSWLPAERRAPMILAVSLNPALDVTHHVAGVDWSGVNRPRQVTVAPGGKALNVARTLRALGSEVLVIGLAGGVTGEAVQSGLAGSGVPGRFAPIAGETRRTFAVVDTRSHDAALFNEPGPAVADGEYREFLVVYENALPGCDAVVLSGSLPPGLPPDTYAGLAARAAAAAVPVVLDAGGPALRYGA